MYFQRYYLDCLSHASYMIADQRTGQAVVVDPQRDVDLYLKDAEEHGFEIKHVILTHFHADFIAGHIELRNQAGAEIHLGARAEAEFDFHKLHEGTTLTLGDVRLTALETPGHTPEGVSILVYDDAQDSEKPYAVLTGDTLFLGDVGRPDLLASIGVTADELANMLYDSLQKLLQLPDETLVYPAHGAGSMCGKSLSTEAVSPLGDQRKYNYALQPMSREEFVALVTADQPEAPDYFVHDAILNRQDRPGLEQAMQRAMKPLPLEQVLQLESQGAQLVDTREPVEFAGAHLKGSLNIPIEGKYATWAGTILDKHTPIVVIADAEGVEESIMRLGRIGFDHVEGYLRDGMDALRERPDLLGRTQRITAFTVPELDPPVQVVDIRTAREWDEGHIDGSLNIPLNQLASRLDEIPVEGHVVVHCQGGYRSSIGVSLLQRHGRDNVLDLVGGFKAWSASKLPVAS